TAMTGLTLALIFYSHLHFAAFEFIEFTAEYARAVVEKVVDFRLFSVDQIFLVGICCTHISTIPWARTCSSPFILWRNVD
ncbi:MAG: hypothetical protein NTV37_05915, partial [Proteobacteria bacterium]|nr:hypothetical protein [Pseudomonadota bacterium]